MINFLTVNGDSYMHVYAIGQGHVELANKLKIKNACSLAIQGSSNSRIIRTTTKHAYHNKTPTLYVVGLSFLGRIEIPVADKSDEFEGSWISVQYHIPPEHKYCPTWDKKHTKNLIDLKLRMEQHSIVDRFEDLVYRVVSMIDSVRSLGHKILVFAQCDALTEEISLLPKFDVLDRPEIIDRLSWLAVRWQEEQGVPSLDEDADLDPLIRHRKPGFHTTLNNFLIKYIKEHKILE